MDQKEECAPKLEEEKRSTLYPAHLSLGLSPGQKQEGQAASE